MIMTKKFFKSFKQRFGEVDTIWYNCNGVTLYLDFSSKYTNVLDSQWYNDNVIIDYEYCYGTFGKNGIHQVKENRTLKLNRTDIITVDFRQYK